MRTKSVESLFRLLLIGTMCLLRQETLAAPLDPSRAEDYLIQFGHLIPSPTVGPSEIQDPKSTFRDGVKSFQGFAGLPVTGELNQETLEMMGKDRCGVPDNIGHRVRRRRRRKRYVAQGSRWPETTLRYYFLNTTRNLDAKLNKEIVKKAFQFWSNASSLVISETSSYTLAHIKLLYAIRSHGDAWPFDGRGAVLAHAFFPDSGGDAHFDDEELWTDGSSSGTNLLQVTTHETGHTLGLAHSSVSGSVMAPFYGGYNPSFHLSQDDIDGIQFLYGSPDGKTFSTPTSAASTTSTTSSSTSSPSTSLPPLPTSSTGSSTTSGTSTRSPLFASFCTAGTVDAIIAIGSTTYAFQGDMYAQLGTNGILPGYPRYIRQEWPDLPENLDAALYLEAVVESDSSGAEIVTEPSQLFFFKGDKYWRYNNTFQLEADYPRLIREGFPGIPDNLDASFVWSGNGKIFFIKGEEYYRYTRWSGADSSYPRLLAVWRGLPHQVDAAFQWSNGRTYFFSGTDFYGFDDITFYTDKGYPKSTTSLWFGCPGF